MTAFGWAQIMFYLVALLALVKPLGGFMARVYQGERTFLDPVLKPLARAIYRLAGIQPDHEMSWQTYALALLVFNGLGLAVVFALQMVQNRLPLNPQHIGPVAPDLTFNAAASFANNTNWQSYSGETTLSYLTQMLGLTVQNFVSAAAGMAVLVALVRGLALDDVTLQHGGSGFGGAIFLRPNSTLILNRATLINNQADEGGAIYGSTGPGYDPYTVIINDSTISGNTAQHAGGGLMVDSITIMTPEITVPLPRSRQGRLFPDQQEKV